MFEQWPNQDNWSTDPLINYLLFTFLVIIPVFRIIKRLGVTKWAILPTLIPYIGFVITTILIAYLPWTYKDKNEVTKP